MFNGHILGKDGPGSPVFQAEVTNFFRPKPFSIPDRPIQLRKLNKKNFSKKVAGSPSFHSILSVGF